MLQSLLISDDDASHRGAQALGEAQTDGVKLCTELLQATCASDDGLPQTGTVAVHLDVVLAGKLGDALDLAQGHDHAVEGVFKADDASGAVMDVVADDDVGLDVLEGEIDAILGDDRLDSSAGQRRYTIIVNS